MTTQSLTLNHQTRLAVQIVIEDDTGALAFSILLATTLLALFRPIGQIVSATGYEVSTWVSDLKAALSFTGKALVIGFNAMAYGFGVSL
jgi:hypothetical protein